MITIEDIVLSHSNYKKLEERLAETGNTKLIHSVRFIEIPNRELKVSVRLNNNDPFNQEDLFNLLNYSAI